MKQLIALLILLSAVHAPAQDAPRDPNDPDVLWSEATLYRDEWGVPHIYADTLRAMAFAFGYAQAEDHLDPMLIAFRAVKGRSAEVLGEERLPQDTYALQMGFNELARDAFTTVDPDVRDLCEGFALGVNTWLLQHPEDAPEWAEGIQPHEILALLHAFLLAHAPFDLPEADVRDPGILSANAWAVTPEHAAAGDAMLVINPHARFDGVYRWYEAHLVADEYELAGATLYGLPVLLVGHDDRLGWALAPNEADIADLYDETTFEHLNPTERYHEVFVKSADALEKRTVMTWRSANGPIVATNVGHPLAWKVGGYGNFDALAQLLDMGRAETLDDFIAALNRNAFPAFNVVYADAAGNVYYTYNAVTGARPSQVLQAADNARRTIWEKPVPAYSTGFEWQDPVAPSQLPSLYNPDAGYIVGSGTPPAGAATGLRPVADPALNWLIRDTDTPRAQRTRELFDRGPRSLHDLQAMLFDHVLPAADAPVERLLEAARQFPDAVRQGHPDLPAALDGLAEWDRTASIDSTTMSWFHIWANLYGRLAAEQPGQVSDAVLGRTALRAASDASRLLANTYQTAFVPWGDVHVLQRGDAELPLAGGSTGDPVFFSDDSEYAGGKWVADSGYAYAMIVQFSSPPTSISLVPFGASDRPDSPHFADQMPLLSERRMKVLHTARSDVLRAAVSARGSLLEFIDRTGRVRALVSADEPIHGKLVAAHRFDRRTEDDLAAFSPFVEPVIAPGDVDIVIDLAFHVPDRLCSEDALDDLAVYAYHPQTGWNAVDEQSLDLERRTFTARDYYDQVYVVLGPEQHLRKDPVEAPGGRTLADIPVQLMPDAPATPRRTVQAPATDHLAEALDDDEQRTPPEPMRTVRPEDNPFGASPGVLVYNPDEAADGPEPPTMPRVANPEFVPEPVARAPERPAAEPEPPLEAPAPQPAANEPGYELEKRGDDTVVIRGRGASGGGPAPDRGSDSRLTVSYVPPSEMRGASDPKPFQLYLAPGSVPASQLQIGTDLDISPSVEHVLLRLHAKSTVRAQGYVVESPPSPLPPGLAAFTPIVAARRAPESTRCTVAVNLRVDPEQCSPANAQKLALYVYDTTSGWMPLETATSPVPLSYQAIDRDARTYAVLGPAALKTTSD